jgi:DNA invertase Pin-like site-specific DNA recombinase
MPSAARLLRQSTPQQVLENRESRERQYALAEFAQRLGWPAERVVVIDEDQGQSATRERPTSDATPRQRVQRCRPPCLAL